MGLLLVWHGHVPTLSQSLPPEGWGALIGQAWGTCWGGAGRANHLVLEEAVEEGQMLGWEAPGPRPHYLTSWPGLPYSRSPPLCAPTAA